MLAWWLITFMFAQVGGPIMAQGVTRPSALSRTALPSTGELAAFVPAGWEKVSEARGDLNRDGVSDQVMLICPSLALQQMKWEDENYSCTACVATEFACTALVLAGDAAGFRLWVADTSVGTSRERQTSYVIKNGVLQVQVSESGGHSSRDITDKYRADGQDLVLIGTDMQEFNAPADQEFSSTNWLTHKRKLRTCSEENGCGRWTTSRVANKRVRFGEARP